MEHQAHTEHLDVPVPVLAFGIAGIFFWFFALTYLITTALAAIRG